MRRVLRAAAGVGLACALVATPAAAVAGVAPLRVMTGSMTGSYDVGAVVLVRAHPATVAVGDVVQVDRDPGDRRPGVVHRVVAVQGGHIRTRGDANVGADPGWTPIDAVQGQVVGALHGPAARLYGAFRTPAGQALTALAALTLLWPAPARRRRRTRPTAHDARVRTDPHAPRLDEAGRTGAAGVTRRQVREAAAT